MRTHEKQAEQFIAIIERAGGQVSFTKAQTGTVYVIVEDSFKARFADHSECYCREDVSVDPEGVSLLQALRACTKATGLDLSKSIKAREAAERRQNEKAAALEAELTVIRAETSQIAAERLDVQRAALIARWPDYDSFPAKKRQRCRHKINQELGL